MRNTAAFVWLATTIVLLNATNFKANKVPPHYIPGAEGDNSTISADEAMLINQAASHYYPAPPHKPYVSQCEPLSGGTMVSRCGLDGRDSHVVNDRSAHHMAFMRRLDDGTYWPYGLHISTQYQQSGAWVATGGRYAGYHNIFRIEQTPDLDRPIDWRYPLTPFSTEYWLCRGGEWFYGAGGAAENILNAFLNLFTGVGRAKGRPMLGWNTLSRGYLSLDEADCSRNSRPNVIHLYYSGITVQLPGEARQYPLYQMRNEGNNKELHVDTFSAYLTWHSNFENDKTFVILKAA